MKYIDADKLIAEIERLAKVYQDSIWRTVKGETAKDFRDKLLAFITSLRQEQPEKSKKNCDDCPHCVDRKDQYGWHFKGCFGGPYKGKFIAEIDECPLKQEQPEVDFEREYSRYMASRKDDNSGNYVTVNMKELARHFYELGKNSK